MNESHSFESPDSKINSVVSEKMYLKKRRLILTNSMKRRASVSDDHDNERNDKLFQYDNSHSNSKKIKKDGYEIFSPTNLTNSAKISSKTSPFDECIDMGKYEDDLFPFSTYELSRNISSPDYHIKEITRNHEDINQKIHLLSCELRCIYSKIGEYLYFNEFNKDSDEFNCNNSIEYKVENEKLDEKMTYNHHRKVKILKKIHDGRYIKHGPLTKTEIRILKSFDQEIDEKFLSGKYIDNNFLLDEISYISSYYFKRLYDYCECFNIETYSKYELRKKIFPYKTHIQDIIYTVPNLDVWNLVHKELVEKELLFTIDDIHYSFDDD